MKNIVFFVLITINLYAFQSMQIKKDYTLTLELCEKNLWQDEEGNASACLKDMYKGFVKENSKYAKKIALTLGKHYDRNPNFRNDKEAFKWYMKSATLGQSEAQYHVAYAYENGSGISKNIDKAIKWYLKAAKQGYSSAALSLGNIFYNKKGYKKAFKWLNIALHSGKDNIFGVPICFRMGNMYLDGKGTNKNYAEAMKCFQKVAKSKSNYAANAQYIIGFMYFEGTGVKKNYIISYAWFNLASSNGVDSSAIFQILEDKLTKDQIVIAQNYDPLEDPKKDKNKNSTQKLTGTGFFINNQQLLTNNHVINNCKRIELIRNGYKSTGTVLVKDELNDLAIIESQKKNNSFLYFRGGKGIRVGDRSIVVGYPLGDLLGSGIKVTTGNISAMTGLRNYTSRLQLTAPVQPGNSGGPVLDKSGNVIAIVVARLNKEQNVNLGIKSKIAQIFLDINNIDYKLSTSSDKKDVAEISEKASHSVVQITCYQ